MAEAGEDSGVAGAKSRKKIRNSFMAASEQWKRNKNGKRLRSKTLEAESALRNWRSPM
jgi:hypothetical protein